jgi:hypothetical protein
MSLDEEEIVVFNFNRPEQDSDDTQSSISFEEEPERPRKKSISSIADEEIGEDLNELN